MRGVFRKLFSPARQDPHQVLRQKYAGFRSLLAANNDILEQIADLEGALAAGMAMSADELHTAAEVVRTKATRMVEDLSTIAGGRHRRLLQNIERIAVSVEEALQTVLGTPVTPPCIALEEITRDLSYAVGAKVANLGEVRNVVGLPVPPGFAVTAFAYRAFVEGSGLQARLTEAWERIPWDDPAGLAAVSREMRQIIVEAEIPQEVREAITLAVRDLYRKAPGRPRIAIRSSAIGEDTQASFAGQYSSFLNVPLEQVLRRYRETLANKFNPQALAYMKAKGFREETIAMSVGCFLMVDAVAAGVAYSLDPADPSLGTMLISAVWGLGKPVVDGSVTPDVYIVPRQPGRGEVEVRVATKARRLVPAPGEGTLEEEVAEQIRDTPCLTPGQMEALAGYVRTLDLHYRCPQDVEWALDREGQLLILQTRPLALGEAAMARAPREDVPAGRRVLLAGGSTACAGIAAGQVVRVSDDADLDTFPVGGVLVARQNSPAFGRVMARTTAIVTDVGGVTGHMASLAREFGVPTITNAGAATSLPGGVEVTVDATHRKVYEGRVQELLLAGAIRRGPQRDVPRLAVMERVVNRIAHLNLIDPGSNAFRAKNCRTYHDVVRFCHEMAISEMFHITDYKDLTEQGVAYRLETDVPLGIYVVDLGGGVNAPAGARVITPEQITSIPMRALWRGMTTPGVRWAGARPIDLRGLFSVWANTMVDTARAERGLGDNSYALVGAQYMNFGSRLGYHFTTLETMCGPHLHENSLSFRFKGGAADVHRRERRVRFIAEVLHRHGFEVDRRQDLLNAWVKKLPRERIEDLLVVLGRLMGCARQLDVTMDTETRVAACVEAFLRGDYDLREVGII
jgi:pyruvate,water dikinase